MLKEQRRAERSEARCLRRGCAEEDARPMTGFALRAQIARRLDEERGTLRKEAARRVALVYPSPYHVAMSSLGFQTIYRGMNAVEEWACDRAFLPDDVAAWRATRLPLFSYERETPVGDYPVVAFSVAYELELTGLFDCL